MIFLIQWVLWLFNSTES